MWCGVSSLLLHAGITSCSVVYIDGEVMIVIVGVPS